MIKFHYSKQNLFILLLVVSLLSNIYLFFIVDYYINKKTTENDLSNQKNKRNRFVNEAIGSADEKNNYAEGASLSVDDASDYANDARNYMYNTEEYMNNAEEYMNNAANALKLQKNMLIIDKLKLYQI